MVPEGPGDPTAVDPRAPYSNPTWLDTSDRAAVKSAFDSIFTPSAPTAAGWTGSINPGVPGTSSQTYRDAALTRINWFRAMAGVPADIQFDATYSSKAQKAALMMSSNKQLSHTPPDNWINWTAEGDEAAGKSNLCLGWSYPQEFLSGDPGCIAGYMEDDGANNTAVGHRRWLLVPQTRYMGTGDVTQTPPNTWPATYPSANAVWVQDGRLFNSRPATRDTFVAWPNKGYVPYQVVPQRWSVSYGSANFFGASVTLTVNGNNVPVTKLPVEPSPGFFMGENTLVWEPSTDFAVQPASDTTVTVTVTGVTGYPGGSTITYNVIIVNPAQAGGSLQAPALSSPANAASAIPVSGTSLNWSASSGATSYDVYFGSTNPPPFLANTTSTTRSLSALSASTTYYWNVVAKNASQSAASGTWSFTTATAAPAAPTLVSPANAATGVATNTSLNWNSASGATSYDVYFGSTNPPPLVTNTTNLTYAPAISNGITYYWRIAAKNSGGTTTSSTYTFSTAAAPTGPGVPPLVYPSNVGTGVPLNVTLSWNAAAGATSYDVYFGTAASPPLVTNTASLNYTPAGLLPSTLYYWRVIARNASGTAPSAIYSFTTAANSTPQTGLRFVPLAPCRLVDTRTAYAGPRTGAFGPPLLGGGTTRTIPIPSSTTCSVPSTAKAYVLNLTLDTYENQTGPVDSVTLWPAGEARPDFHTARTSTGGYIANAAVVKAGVGGAINAWSSNNVNLILDINGYFTDDPVAPGLLYYPINPCRAVDTRGPTYSTLPAPYGNQRMQAQESRSFRLPGSPACQIPAAAAYSMQLTLAPGELTNGAPVAFITAYPTGLPQPNISNMNALFGYAVANSAIVPASANGSIDVYAHDATNLIVDVNGYFAPDDGTGRGLYYFPATQCRVLNTLDGSYTGAFGGPALTPPADRVLSIPTGRCGGLPASAKAWAANVSVVPNGVAMPYLSMWPAGTPWPNISQLNAFQGQTLANSGIVPADAQGAIAIRVAGLTHATLEVSGYFGR
jgi:hypothetical protein